MPPLDLAAAEAIIAEAVPHVAPAVQFAVRWRGTSVFAAAYGWRDPATRQWPVGPATLFDLASVTKLFVVAAFMTLVEQGCVTLDQQVATILPELQGRRPIAPYENPLVPGALVTVDAAGGEADAGAITFRQVLSHSAGLPAWRPLFRQPNRAAALAMALGTPLAYAPGSRVLYSDIGLILLGLCIEQLAGTSLDAAVVARVTQPLGLAHTRYLPVGAPAPADVAPTEICAWRGRRVVGEVHDENAAGLGGVSGHAGLFSTATDVAAFGQAMLGETLLRSTTVAEMAGLHAEFEGVRRGLGFALWSPDPEASGNPFSQRAYGHTGFTGTSLWVDPQRDLVVALLTNDVYAGREGRGIAPLRVRVHRAVVAAVDAAALG